jgi:hypothetical protein
MDISHIEINLEEKGSLQPVLKQSVSASSYRDDATLARLGKKPVLKRNFGFMTILGFSCTVLITWEGSLTYILSGALSVFHFANSRTARFFRDCRSNYIIVTLNHESC